MYSSAQFEQHQPAVLLLTDVEITNHTLSCTLFTHAGRNFDKDGNMYNWWSNFSTELFEEQSKCMVQQYGKFSWKLAGGQNVMNIFLKIYSHIFYTQYKNGDFILK